MINVVLEAMKTAYVADHFQAFTDLHAHLSTIGDNPNVDELKTLYYDVGKNHFENLREWFLACYVVFLGKFEGPRMWEMTKMMGVDRFVDELNHHFYIIQKSEKFN